MRLRRVVGREGLWVAEVVSDYGGQAIHCVSVVELKEGNMWRDTRYSTRSLSRHPNGGRGGPADGPLSDPSLRRSENALRCTSEKAYPCTRVNNGKHRGGGGATPVIARRSWLCLGGRRGRGRSG